MIPQYAFVEIKVYVIWLTEWSEAHRARGAGFLGGGAARAGEATVCETGDAGHAIYTGLTPVGGALHQSDSLSLNLSLNWGLGSYNIYMDNSNIIKLWSKTFE